MTDAITSSLGSLKDFATSSTGGAAATGAAGGALAGALSTLFSENPTLMKALKRALAGGAVGGGIGAGTHVVANAPRTEKAKGVSWDIPHTRKEPATAGE